MVDDQQFCLKWNNHQSTLIQNFDTLLESGTLVDCTLAAEGKYLKAHRVVLSACSPYFEGLLSEHYDKHPVFILKDVKFKELKAMIDYMYKGEVNISQDQLTALLKAAESLQIKGLSESKTGGSNGNNKSLSRVSKVPPQPRSSPLNISYASAGLNIERNRVPRQASSIGDLPEDSHSPQIPKEHSSSREGSQSPTSKRRRKLRRKSAGEDTSVENHEASDSNDIPQQMGVPALAIAPVADEKTNADPTDSLGRSTLMTQLTKPADEMLQMPLENPEPSDNLIEPKSEYMEDQEESVEDLTLDDDMNELNEIERDTNRAGPSHDTSQHPAGLATWHVTGDRSNAGGVVGSVAGAPGATVQDEVFLAAQEAAEQAHRESQDSQIILKTEHQKQKCWVDLLTENKMTDDTKKNTDDDSKRNLETPMAITSDNIELDDLKQKKENLTYSFGPQIELIAKQSNVTKNDPKENIEKSVHRQNVENQMLPSTSGDINDDYPLKENPQAILSSLGNDSDAFKVPPIPKLKRPPRPSRPLPSIIEFEDSQERDNQMLPIISADLPREHLVSSESCQIAEGNSLCQNDPRSNHLHNELLNFFFGIDINKRSTEKLETYINYAEESVLKKKQVIGRSERFPCPKCSSTFCEKFILNRHLNYECGQEPRFQCVYCQYRCKRAANVYKHVRMVHQESEDTIILGTQCQTRTIIML
ncbi:PREDICTED: zinc finger and BTB domain-containing protein 5 isoform X3 [Polistes dominula]|uniref:Zinc finger and BTB domain-containing protein 5 isoform X3 n=1 Tax=Polistes dominula TaxID=743375 RepID=A0ABM1IEG9_POLDO|nr:PREDICTED: zinc finger and BTB domain-containing protein 5 isoform X3 [Polistes dominula]